MRPLIFTLDSEIAHRISLKAVKVLGAKALSVQNEKPNILRNNIAGLEFATPIGVAPGYDKDAEVFEHILRLGYGFTEVGTLTPLPQHGNPKPRLFRLIEDEAVINRMGFNNQGQAEAAKKLEHSGVKAEVSHKLDGILGINIGANKDSSDRVGDYCRGVRNMSPFADYLTVNISSPNTPGLRDLQGKKALRKLLSAVMKERNDCVGQRILPIFLKVAPDLHYGDMEDIVEVSLELGVDALIISNTTISRPDLKSKHAHEAGGLSGAPLKELALKRLQDFYEISKGAIPLIGVGGVSNASDAYERIKAGASLVQIYSAMVYEGPFLGRDIAKQLITLLEKDGFKNISEVVGVEARK